MSMAFVKSPSDLELLFAVSDVEDLDVLSDYLTDSGNGRLAIEPGTEERLSRCKRNGSYPREDRDLIAKEIRLFGGNTIVNMFRGEGVSYEVIVKDVANHLKVSCNENSAVPTIEEGILRKILTDAFGKMSEEERQGVLKELKVTNLTGLGPAGAVALLGAAKAGGFTTYKIALIVANAIAKAILKRGLSLPANALLTRTMGILLGPIGWVVTSLWSLADIASPAYRVTVPCVIQIAYMRQKALTKDSSSICPSCNALNAKEANYCSECGAAMMTSSDY